MNNFIIFETISDYNCEKCQKKVEIRKGSKIKKLPLYLTFNINRIDMDENFQDYKLTHEFDFPLELDMNMFLSNNVNPSDDNNYELFAIINHTGSTEKGHYYSYIRDFNNEGNYNLIALTEYLKEPILERNDKEEKEEKKEEKKEENKEEKKEEKKENDSSDKPNDKPNEVVVAIVKEDEVNKEKSKINN